MKIFFAFSALTLATQPCATAQTDVYLHVNHTLSGQPFAFGQTHVNDLGDSFTFNRVEYYMSGFSLQHDGAVNSPIEDLYILATADEPIDVLLGNFNINILESVSFGIGVEAPVNNEDPALWPSNHPLAFQSPSMHWGWSSGYRFIALEGNSGPGMASSFEMHGLWNDNYFIQTVQTGGTTDGNELHIYLDADYTMAVKGIGLASGPIDHGTNETDLQALTNFRNHVFSPGTVGLHEVSEGTKGHIYPNPAKHMCRIGNGTDHSIQLLSVYDASGRQVLTDSVFNGSMLDISSLTPGSYTVSVTAGLRITQMHKLIVHP